MNAGEFPQRITIEPTNRCNLECTFCPRHLVEMKLGDMDWTLYRKIIDEAAAHLPITAVLFFRGESLLCPDLEKMIAYAKKSGVGPIQLASNGFLLTEERGKTLIAAGLDFISFSLDTIDANVYRQTRLHSDLAIAMCNVIRFVEICDALRAQGKKTPEIQVSSVDVEAYRNRQDEFVDFWRQYADRVRIYMEHSADGHLGSIRTNLPIEGTGRRPCGKVYNDMIVYWNGDVAICNHDWDNRGFLGNLKMQSIQEIWLSERYQAVRQMHESGNFSQEMLCGGCDHWKMYYLPEGIVGQIYEHEEKGGARRA